MKRDIVPVNGGTFMKCDIVIGTGHPLAPHFILHRLRRGCGGLTCLSGDKRSADALSARLRVLLERREAGGEAGDEGVLGRLTVVGAPDAGAEPVAVHRDASDKDANGKDANGKDASDKDASDNALFLFLSGADAAALLKGSISDSLHRSLLETARFQASAFGGVHVITDFQHLAGTRSIDRGLEKIERVLVPYFEADTGFHVYCLGAYCFEHGDADGQADCGDFCACPVEALADQIIGTVFDVKRRSAEYFDRYPLRLAVQDCGPIRLMPALEAAEFLARADHETKPGRHLVYGSRSYSVTELLERVAEATRTDLRGAAAGELERADAASGMLREAIRRIAEGCRLGAEGAEAMRPGGANVHEIPAAAPDLAACVERALKARQSESLAMRRSFAALPGMKLGQTANTSLRYFAWGSGPQVLLVVNTLALSLDFWQMLAGALGERFRIIAIDRRPHAGGETCLSQAYYSTQSYVGDYVRDVVAVLDCEGAQRCHVVGWCSGGRLALELPHAIPERVESLSLVAPSFAGMDGFKGCDSAYERSLHTMCRIVNQTPKAAASMAGSMTAIMKKSSNDLDRFGQEGKDAVDVLELADSQHLPLLYQAFLNAENMIEFSRQVMNFRAHDVAPRLGDAALQLPVMLITGGADTTTSSERARDLCSRLPNIVGFEIKGSSHYLIHQNYRIVAGLLTAFTRDGTGMAWSDPRVERSLFNQSELLVMGEL